MFVCTSCHLWCGLPIARGKYILSQGCQSDKKRNRKMSAPLKHSAQTINMKIVLDSRTAVTEVNNTPISFENLMIFIFIAYI